MKFIDLHAHPVFKTVFNNLSPWTDLPISDHLLGDILESQSNLRQSTTDGHCNLICMTLGPVETAIIDQWLFHIAPIFFKVLDAEILCKMRSGDLDYQEARDKELENLHKPPETAPAPREIVVLKDFKDYDPNDLSKLYVIFNIEGGHSFYNKGNHTSNIPQMFLDFQAFVNRGSLILYITPAHLTENIFITHAYGNKILPKGKMLPVGAGIKGPGTQFLDIISKTKLLVDVKHMSLVSRQAFYANSDWNKKPLLCSHAGITGFSWKDKLNKEVTFKNVKEASRFVKVRYYKPKGLLRETYFNPCSINLYNEDIIKILESKGLIGISFDIRIIGGDRDVLGFLNRDEKEFLSKQEFEHWKEQNKAFRELTENDYDAPYEDHLIDGELPDEIWDDEDWKDHQEELNALTKKDIDDLHNKGFHPDGKAQGFRHGRDRKVEHTRYFINQVLHIVKVGKDHDPWKHICLGTDFDGFIKAVDSCKNSSQLDEFAQLLIHLLPEAAEEANIPLPASAEIIVNDIFFNNAFRFMSAHFLKSAAPQTAALQDQV